MSDDAKTGIENLSQESRTFSPPTEFVQNSVGRPSLYQEAERDRLAFWRSRASLLSWETPFTETLDWSNPPFARWFADGTLNVAYNCVDRHVESGHGSQVALLAEYEDGSDASFTYADVKDEISRMANVLTDLGVKTGDRVVIYLPMVPEAVFAMLACARIGAPHSVVFGGFSAEALRSRIEDAEARVVITADGQNRRGKQLPLKSAVDEALAGGGASVEKVLVVRRTGGDVEWTEGRDVWWHEAREAASNEHAPVAVEAEHPLFILYTSGTTGKPKGIIHTTGGYLTQAAYTHRNVFDLKPSTDVYWCTADVGWVTGHTYVVYGPMANRATQVIYEGTPDTPHQGRWWEIIQKHKVSLFYSSPTAIRTAMKWGEDIPAKFDLSSLRLLGSVGEAINPE
ncbi:MAG: AMP-binding protein, partial [Brachybacterium sp.]